MKRHIFGAIAIICLIFPQIRSAYGETPDEMMKAAKQLDAKFTEAFNRGDLDGVMAIYWNSPELVVYPPGQLEAKGYAAVHEGIGAVLKGMPGGKIELTETHYLPVGDAVIVYGLWKISFPDNGGAAPSLVGRFTEVAMKKDGKWVLVLDHPSVPLPAPRDR